MPLLLKNARFSASALLLLSLGGVWLWTRTSQKEEISGKDVQAAVRPETEAAQTCKPRVTEAPDGESRVALLLEEAYCLTGADPLLHLWLKNCSPKLWFKNYRYPNDPEKVVKSSPELWLKNCSVSEDLEALRQASCTPEFRRWREIVKELIAIGSVPYAVEKSRRRDSLVASMQLLHGLSRLDGAEADPEALQDAFQLNSILSDIEEGWDRVLHNRLTETLGQQSPESLSDFTTFLRGSSATQSRDISVMLQRQREDFLGFLLKDPEGIFRTLSLSPKSEHKLLDVFHDPIQVQELQRILKRLDGKLHLALEQSHEWPQREQAFKDFRDSLLQDLDGRLPADLKGVFVNLVSPCGLDINRFINNEARRQGLEAALLVEQFRREQGRLPASLEETGWIAPTEATDLNYTVKDGKAVLSVQQKYAEYFYRDKDCVLVAKQQPFEVKW
jgi:hypothetical protein